jgi:hypothetical protein
LNKKIITIIIILFFVSINIIQAQTQSNSYKVNNKDLSKEANILIRIDTDENINMISDAEIVGGKPGKYLDVIVSKYTLNILDSKNIEYLILNQNINENYQSASVMYRRFSEIETSLQQTADTYPEFTSLYSLGKSYQDRDIWCLEITDNPGMDEDEPGVFFMGLHHAREWPTVEICLYIIEQLTTLYSTDPEIQNLVNNRRVWIVPVVNPDGYYYSHDQGNDWRKNRHYFEESNTIGVDLNRNYPGSSNGNINGAWGTLSGSISINPASEVYCGPGPASEREIQAVKNVFIQNDICTCISWHTYGELVMWPWGYTGEESTPDDTYMSQIGVEMASRIASMEGYGNYQPTQSAGLYPTTGDTTDWAYGYYHYVLGKPMFAYTIEACTSFHPSSGKLDSVVEENYDGALYLLEEAENIKNTVVPRVVPPKINDLAFDSDGDYEISWDVVNPDSYPEYFQLDEITNLAIDIDDAESSSEYWELIDFERTNEKAYSGSYSYKSKFQSAQVFSMISKQAIPIKDEMGLSFNTWYNFRDDDFTVVEVSTNGRSYDIIDKLTGCSDGWISKEYSLDEYVGQSIFIRFRNSRESGGIAGRGFYVDDIYPIADYNKINTLSDQIQTNSYQIDDREDGVYYYRVKGYNSEHGWGDFSTLKQVIVGDSQPNKPDTPVGNKNGKTGTEYTYITSTTDPQGESLFYLFDWGDGTDSGWLGPYDSGETVESTHSWQNQGMYIIRVKARDTNNVESVWSEPLTVTMPRARFYENTLLNYLFVRLMAFLKN